MILPVELSLSIKNQFLIFKIPLQVYGYLNLLDISGSLLDNFIFRQLRVSHFQDYTVKRNDKMNLITAKNGFDSFDAMVGQLAIDSLEISW